MKYKRLEKSELVKLEKDFVDFLVISGITADDWVKIKESEPQKAEFIIDQFSDVIWAGVLRKLKYLELRVEGTFYCFKCDQNKMNLILVHGLDTTTEGEDLDKALSNSNAKLTIQKAQKKYNNQREFELFGMIEQGCVISEGKLYEQLDQQPET